MSITYYTGSGRGIRQIITVVDAWRFSFRVEFSLGEDLIKTVMGHIQALYDSKPQQRRQQILWKQDDMIVFFDATVVLFNLVVLFADDIFDVADREFSNKIQHIYFKYISKDLTPTPNLPQRPPVAAITTAGFQTNDKCSFATDRELNFKIRVDFKDPTPTTVQDALTTRRNTGSFGVAGSETGSQTYAGTGLGIRRCTVNIDKSGCEFVFQFNYDKGMVRQIRSKLFDLFQKSDLSVTGGIHWDRNSTITFRNHTIYTFRYLVDLNEQQLFDEDDKELVGQIQKIHHRLIQGFPFMQSSSGLQIISNFKPNYTFFKIWNNMEHIAYAT